MARRGPGDVIERTLSLLETWGRVEAGFVGGGRSGWSEEAEARSKRRPTMTRRMEMEFSHVLSTYRMVGMDAIEIFLYRSKCSQPTYQWIAMMKTIIIDAQYGS